MSLYQAIAKALTSEIPAEAHIDSLSAVEIVKYLEALGWDASRILDHRSKQLAQQNAWPEPLSRELRGDIGAAQAQAIMREVITLMGLSDPIRTRDASQPLSKHDLDLIAEIPPHHGKVG